MLSNNQLQDICGAILPIDQQIRTQAQARLDNLTKPPGSLGKLEMLAAQACAISGRLDYKPRRKVIVTFAADHGVVEEGVSRYPSHKIKVIEAALAINRPQLDQPLSTLAAVGA